MTERGKHKQKIEIILKAQTTYPSKMLHFLLKYKFLVSKYNHVMLPTFHGFSYKKLYKCN